MCLPAGFQKDHQPSAPYKRRVYAQGYGKLDPMSYPWAEWRKYPEKFPDNHIAKVASVRTVVGVDFETDGGETERIYLKRSYGHHSPMKRFLSIFRQTKEWKELRLAQKFATAGVIIPDPVFYAEAIEPSGKSVVFYATRSFTKQWQEGRHFFEDAQRFEEEWDSLARYTKWLHDNRILHSDYRSDHVWFNQQAFDEENQIHWALMDLDGSRVGWPVGRVMRHRALYQLAESLIRVGLKEEFLERFLRLYDPEGRYSFSSKEIYQIALQREEISLKRRSKKK